MQLTPAIKGQITKAVNHQRKFYNDSPFINRMIFAAVGSVFEKHMPHQQAKHATRKYLSRCSG